MPLSLYNSPDVHINNLLREAHPEGGTLIINDKNALVEDSIEAQLITIKTLYQTPIVKTLAQLAEKLDEMGIAKLASAIDDMNFNFCHQPLFVKTALVPAPIDFGSAVAPVASTVAVPALSSLSAGTALSIPGIATVGSLAILAGLVGIGAGRLFANITNSDQWDIILNPDQDSIFAPGEGQARTPYFTAITNIKNDLERIDQESKTLSILETAAIIRRAKNQTATILKQKDVEPEEKSFLTQVYTEVNDRDQKLGAMIAAYAKQMEQSAGNTNMAYLQMEFTKTKKAIDDIQRLAQNTIEMSQNPDHAENQINKLFNANITAIQQFKRAYNVVANNVELSASEKTKAINIMKNINEIIKRIINRVNTIK